MYREVTYAASPGAGKAAVYERLFRLAGAQVHYVQLYAYIYTFTCA